MGIGLARELAKIAIHDPDSMSAGHLLAATLSAALMLPDPRMPGMLYPLDPPAWSLFFELLINAAFAWWLVRARTGTLALILLAALAGLFAGAAIQDSMNQGSFWDGFPTGIARVTSMFTAGVLITRLSRPAFRRRSWWTLVPLAAFVAVLAMPFQNPPWLVHAGLVAIGAPALVWCGTRFEVPATATRLCGWLGDISYPVYLIHTPLIFAWHMAARRLHMPWLGEIAGFVAFVAAFGTVLALADTRLRAMLAARLHVRRSAPLQTVAD
jgi:peptidoglycan/LPS O-acetylase OafA/YrhL